MLWPEKVLLVGGIAVVVYVLYLSFAFVPIYDDLALTGPVFLPP
jgi:hypothetical protein